MKFKREWAMPTPDTFDCEPIGAFVRRYLEPNLVSVDPFARNKRWATYTNDINPDTAAEYHLEARDFLWKLKQRDVSADIVICDPPYSQVQVSRSYENAGREYKPFGDDNNAVLYRDVRNGMDAILKVDGIALSFGWNSAGFGVKRGYEIVELLLVCHGGAHNDTVCLAERKLQASMDFSQVDELAEKNALAATQAQASRVQSATVSSRICPCMISGDYIYKLHTPDCPMGKLTTSTDVKGRDDPVVTSSGDGS